MTLGASLVVSIVLIYLDPILSLRLVDLGMHKYNVGLGFALMAFTYTLGCVLIGCTIADKVDGRFIITVSLLVLSIANLLASGLEGESLTVTFVGLALVGFGCAGTFLPQIPEVITSMTLDMLEDNAPE